MSRTKDKTGYQMMHESIGGAGTITEAERLLLDAHRTIRRAETDTEFAHALDIWWELQTDVSRLAAGEELSEGEEGADLARSIFAYIKRRREEEKEAKA